MGRIIPYIMENKKMKPPDRCYTPAIYHSIYRCCCHCLFHVFSLTVGHSRAYHVKLPNIGGSSHRSVKQSPAFFAVSPWNSIPLWSGFRGFLLTATASPIEVAKLTTHYLTLPRHVRWKRMVSASSKKTKSSSSKPRFERSTVVLSGYRLKNPVWFLPAKPWHNRREI